MLGTANELELLQFLYYCFFILIFDEFVEIINMSIIVQDKFLMTYVVNSEVVLVPPMSWVLTCPACNVLATALDTLLANMGNPRYLNIITELKRMEVGLARFFPAMFIPE